MGLAHLTEMELVCLSLGRDGDIDVIDRLIWGNASINARPIDLGRMNPTQRAVGAFSEFLGQVQNGGISQYIFNCPEQLKYLIAALPLLEWPKLEAKVKGALSALDSSMIAELGSTHEVWDNEEAEFADRWAAFRKWADAFDGDAFDRWFYKHDAEYVRRLMSLIWHRRADLITGAAAE